MQRDHVEAWQRPVVQQIIEGGFAELDVVQPGCGRQAASAGNVRRVEVNRRHLGPRVCGRDQVRGKALSTAQVAVGERLALASGRGDPFRERRKAQDGRDLDAAKIMHIGRVSDVSGPPVGHGYSPPRSLTQALRWLKHAATRVTGVARGGGTAQVQDYPQ